MGRALWRNFFWAASCEDASAFNLALLEVRFNANAIFYGWTMAFGDLLIQYWRKAECDR
jgi:hypothetical protein